MESDTSSDNIQKSRDEERGLIEKQEADLRKKIAELHHEEKRMHVTRDTGRFNISSVIKEKLQTRYLLSFALYLVIAFIIFIPITAHITTVSPGAGADFYQNLWDIWWVGYAIFTLHSSIWYTSLFFPPLGASLIYQTMMPIGSLLSVPFQALGIPFAYNVMFFLSFAISGITMFILAEYLTKNRHAAFLSGLIFAFSSFHIAQAIAHIDWMFIAWVPLSIYFLLKMIRNEHPIWNAAGLGVSFVLAVFMGDVEQGLLLIVAFIVIAIAYLPYKDKRRSILGMGFLKALAVFVVVAFVVGAFGFVPIAKALLSPNTINTASQLNGVGNNELYSVNLLSFFLPSYYNSIFHGLASSAYYYVFAGDPTEKIAYVGYVALLLAAFGVYKNYKEKRQVWLWVVVALAFAWLALGPYIQIGPDLTPIPGIFLVYHSIPGFNILREPGRFDLVAEVAVAVLAAFGADSLLKTLKADNSKTLMLVAVFSIIILFESSGIMYGAVASTMTTSPHVPPIYYSIRNTTGNFSILSLPALADQSNIYPEVFSGEATYYTSVTHKALVGGFLTRGNTSQEEYMFNIPIVVQVSNLEAGGGLSYESPVKENPMNQTLLTLYNYNTGLITVDENGFNMSTLDQLVPYMEGTFGTPVQSNTTLVFFTANAMNGSIYRSFVAYPVLTDWATITRNVSGTPTVLWAPINPGPIIVYAPYANETGISQKVARGTATPIEGNVVFQAEAYPSPTTLEIAGLDQNGNAHELATFNITNTAALDTYSFKTTFYSGPGAPTTLLFVANNATGSYVFLKNITFSK